MTSTARGPSTQPSGHPRHTSRDRDSTVRPPPALSRHRTVEDSIGQRSTGVTRYDHVAVFQLESIESGLDELHASRQPRPAPRAPRAVSSQTAGSTDRQRSLPVKCRPAGASPGRGDHGQLPNRQRARRETAAAHDARPPRLRTVPSWEGSLRHRPPSETIEQCLTGKPVRS